jgi:acyl carrier protein
MLIGNDLSRVRAVVHEAVTKLVQDREESPGQIGDDDGLSGSLGLRSLDLARLIFELELALEVNPFARLVPITSVRTVGDLVNAFALALNHGEAVDISAEILDAEHASELRRRRRGLT